MGGEIREHNFWMYGLFSHHVIHIKTKPKKKMYLSLSREMHVLLTLHGQKESFREVAQEYFFFYLKGCPTTTEARRLERGSPGKAMVHPFKIESQSSIHTS